ncbi:MAG: glycosyltransferase family 39 protein [Candidatus Nealsonbacteria bacterium]|nr:glycosyltransferase family 39 protein [Candidatus Nealsonbacteria bacterium]
MSNRLTNVLAAAMFSFILIVTVSSIRNDSLTMDELAHLPAGYSYLTQQDMRLNPEHPPLIKDLAAFPLLFIEGIKFPSEVKAWKDDVNGQWDFGNKLLFRSGNPAEEMIFWSRIPMILVLLLLGFFVFRWARELYGKKISLLALFLFAFSPTLLAHGRLVTTDVGAALGVVLASYYFLRFLKDSSKRNLAAAGVALGLALLTKFSTILILPFLGFLILAWAWLNSSSGRQFLISFFTHCLKFIVILAIALTMVWLLYAYHVWNYPPEKQAQDASSILASHPIQALRKIIPPLSYSPVLRPLAYYLLGLVMVFQRGAAGNTTYFLGEVSATGWKNYFPVVYLIKEPLPFFLLLLIGVLTAAYLMKKPFWQSPRSRFKEWLKGHFTEFSFLSFIALYWLTTLGGNLNIGVRHLLPVFPFTILLTSGLTLLWLRPPFLRFRLVLLGLLLAWQAVSVVNVYPSFLAYFNELAGGSAQGHIYVVDSNLDWGQDLKRLNQWLEKNKIEKIYLDYFGGSDTRYYLSQKYLPWRGDQKPEELTETPYLAVSATLLQGGRGEAAKGFQDKTGYYRWLDQYSPLAQIGYSIFVYKIK